MQQEGIWEEQEEHQLLFTQLRTPFLPHSYRRKVPSQFNQTSLSPSLKVTCQPRLPQSFQLNLKERESSDQNEDQEYDSENDEYLNDDGKWLYKKYEYERGSQLDKKYFASLFIPLYKIKDMAKKKPVYSMADLDIETHKGSQFDSAFESGNLFAVSCVDSSYRLYLSNDLNSTGNTLWFFFTIKIPPHVKTLNFKIMNLGKPDSLFAHGMKPLVRTVGSTTSQWKRVGVNVTYQKSNARKERHRKQHYHNLSFSIPRESECQEMQVAYSYPYTYQRLKEFLAGINNTVKSRYCKHQVLCKSFGGVPVNMLVISEEPNSYKSTVLIMGRQHPGQTPSSFTIEGIVNFLLAKTKEAEFLRQKYIFKIIPFMNVDGVLFGNYRASLTGKDPNRQWDNPQPSYFPEIMAVKQLTKILVRKNKLKAVFDIHSHSRKMKSFFYGVDQGKPLQSRLLPFFCSRMSKDISFQDSIFHLSKCKQQTARGVLARISGCPYIYTFQMSFFGTIRNGQKVHFQPQDYSQLGEELISGLYHLLLDEVLKESGDEETSFFQKITRQLKENKILQKLGDRDSGSEIDPSEDEIDLNTVLPEQEAPIQQINQPDKLIKLPQPLSYYRERQRGPHSNRYNELQIKKILPTIKDRSLMCLQPAKQKRNISFGVQYQRHSKVRESKPRRTSLQGLCTPYPINHSFNLNIRSIQKELQREQRLQIEPLKMHIKQQGRKKGKRKIDCQIL